MPPEHTHTPFNWLSFASVTGNWTPLTVNHLQRGLSIYIFVSAAAARLTSQPVAVANINRPRNVSHSQFPRELSTPCLLLAIRGHSLIQECKSEWVSAIMKTWLTMCRACRPTVTPEPHSYADGPHIVSKWVRIMRELLGDVTEVLWQNKNKCSSESLSHRHVVRIGGNGKQPEKKYNTYEWIRCVWRGIIIMLSSQAVTHMFMGGWCGLWNKKGRHQVTSSLWR